MFKVNNEDTERHQWRHSGVIIVNFEHILQLVLVSLLLTLSNYMPVATFIYRMTWNKDVYSVHASA